MAVVFSLIFGRFVLVFTAFVCMSFSGRVFFGWVAGVLGGCNNVLSLAFYLTALLGATL